MQEAYKIKDQNGMYFLTMQIVNWIDYIHNNPVKVGIVEHPEEYLFKCKKLCRFR